MLKSLKKLFKKLLISNVALIAVALPSQGSLLIPQEQLDSSFQVAEVKEPQIQVPITYVYMSQGYSSYHPAIDLATDPKTPIKPILPGTVVEAGYSSYGYGNSVVIKHSNGLESRYAHLSKIGVKKGDKVTEDSIIGIVGSTGHSTGVHLHLEIHQNGKTLNPLSVLPAIYKRGLLTSKAAQASLTSHQQ